MDISQKKKKSTDNVEFHGGEKSALSHINQYFSSDAPSSYKVTRNALSCEKDDWPLSSKFSPWLANGCLSARYIINALSDYEHKNTANESTYWIAFELLWREYFQWYTRQHGKQIFARTGIQPSASPASFYPQRFQQWCHGSTPWPLVNACMKQLNQTGFLSNRGRQIVASCLIYELGLDCRCGAAYFEQQLIDYDVAANWGNWQYIAGVGADPRGGRQFSIAKQQQLYDPKKIYIKRWQGDINYSTTIDSVDAADWPIPIE
jgi:deoxyribodipyrimidine photo-lyase